MRHVPKVWLHDAELREKCLGFLVLYRGVHNNVVAWYPIDWCSNPVLVTSLEGVEDAQDFSRVAASGGWVGEDKTDRLLWVDWAGNQ
jgi:hypothetical protein